MSQRSATEARMRARRAREAATSRGGGGAPDSGGAPGHGGESGRQASSAPAPLTRATSPGLGARLRYRFDATLSRGSGALILWLAFVTTVFVALMGLGLYLVEQLTGAGDASGGIGENAWQALMRTLDPGTVTGDAGTGYRAMALLITLSGIFIFSTLVGLIASVIDRTIENLRKGRGLVVEEGHTLVLGWSDKLHTILDELRIASANHPSSCVVVMAPRDRVEMEDELASRHPGCGGWGLRRRSGLRIVCRTGDPADPADLALVAPTRARSIVVLAEHRPSADAQTVKVLLGLMSFNARLAGMEVTVEVDEEANAAAIEQATGGRVRTVVSSELIARVTAQICRQAGMGAVYQELLDFDGDELYFQYEPRLVGATYGQALLSYETSSIIGVRWADGRIQLNPPTTSVLGSDDQVIAISQDDDTVVVSVVDGWSGEEAVGIRGSEPLPPDHILLIGWNDNAPRVLQQLARAASAGSRVDVVVEGDLATVDEARLPDSDVLEVHVVQVASTTGDVLATALDARTYERIVLLSYRDALAAADADARTLLTLVQLRRLLVDGHRNARASIVAELLDARSVQLGRVANPDDFVVSERLTSLLIAQLSENGELSDVFAELLDAEDVEIAMQPLTGYVPAGADGEIEFRELVRAARRRGESAFGFTVAPSGDSDGVCVNPAKSTAVPVDDSTQLIVLA